MNTQEIRAKISEFIKFGFTQKEAFDSLRESKRVTRSGHALAEALGKFNPDFDQND